MKKAFFCLFTLYSASAAFGQNVVDLVRYSNIQLQGSARFESMGGSFGALGADISSTLINPAGYGRFSSNQFHAGLNFNNIQNTSTFQGVVTETSRNPVRPSSAGIVIVNDVSRKNKGFLYNQIGFTYNRVDNLTNTIGYKGKLYNSLLDVFSADGNQVAPADLPTYLPFSTNLAWQTYAIDQNGTGGYTPRLTIADTMFQRRDIETKGGVSEYTFSYSTNYINRLYFGINWGIRTIRYTEQYNHREMLDNATLSLDSFNYQYNLNTKGSGSNFKIGVIYLPFESLRLGLSVHTPTFYSLTDQWSAGMTSYHGDTTYALTAEAVTYKYRLRTPSKFIGSVAYVFGTRGSINVDLEYMDYKWANLKSTKDATYNPPPNEYKDQNSEADDLLRPVLNVRVGGEVVFQSQYFLRAGYAYYPHPYKQEDFSDGNKGASTYSVGAGIRLKRSSIDFAYKLQNKRFNYYAFPESRAEVSSVAQGFVLSYSLSF